MFGKLCQVIAVMAVSTCFGAASAQQGPVFLGSSSPKPARKAPGASLMVICDVACTWSVDGKPGGSMAAETPATIVVDAGQHELIAATPDGLDKYQKQFHVSSGGQQSVMVELKQIRDARVQAEKIAEEKKEEEERKAAALKKLQEQQAQAALDDTKQGYTLFMQQRYVESKFYSERACTNGNLAACKL
ncbi:MAG TPA: hypothetical protein VF730_00875, partial [Terracidiphilus sp.]